jgi:hypothetical protein
MPSSISLHTDKIKFLQSMVFFVCFSPYESQLCRRMYEKWTMKARSLSFSIFRASNDSKVRSPLIWYFDSRFDKKQGFDASFLVFFEKFSKK